MTTYFFRCETGSAGIPLTRAEGKLYVMICESPDWEVPVFGVHKKDAVQRRRRDDLLARTQRLLASLEAQAALLPFTYALDAFPAGAERCRLRREPVDIEFGPGFCRIVTSEIVQVPGSSASAVVTRQLVDLRDMRPVLLDDGRQVRAVRRPGRHDLLGKVQLLKRFLDSAASDSIDCSVEY